MRDSGSIIDAWVYWWHAWAQLKLAHPVRSQQQKPRSPRISSESDFWCTLAWTTPFLLILIASLQSTTCSCTLLIYRLRTTDELSCIFYYRSYSNFQSKKKNKLHVAPSVSKINANVRLCACIRDVLILERMTSLTIQQHFLLNI
jgi:hypothetical protein